MLVRCKLEARSKHNTGFRELVTTRARNNPVSRSTRPEWCRVTENASDTRIRCRVYGSRLRGGDCSVQANPLAPRGERGGA